MKQLSRIAVFFCLLLITTACTTGHSPVKSPAQTEKETTSTLPDNPNKEIDYSESDLEKLYVAGGCFWGVEAYFARISGVSGVTSGYANGTGENPTYNDVISGDDGFAEAVEITFDPDRVSLEELLAHFFRVIDPTSVNQQGNDVGIQYRTGIYYVNDEMAPIIENAVRAEQESYDKEIVTEVEPLDNYYLAEEEHQAYLEKNPNGYCHIDLNILNEDD